MPLTAQEQDHLHGIITTLFGYDSQLESLKSNYTERTVDIVEQIIESVIECNNDMKQLVVSLLGGARYFTKGWLKKILNALRQHAGGIQCAPGFCFKCFRI